MKKAVILHGTDGAPDHNWFPWAKKQLEERGYQIWIPELPNNHTPNRQVYNDFLLNSDWDFTDNLVIGHSSGAVSVLNLLEDERCPKIRTAVLVGAWSDTHEAGLDHGSFEKDQFRDLFPPNGFKFEVIKSKANNFIYVHGDDDPYCPIEQARWLAEHTGGDFITVSGGGHLSHGFGYTELPELITALEERQLL